MESVSKTVCIIGAGAAGISAIKSCLEEGLEPTCFETRSDLGGTWNYKKSEKTNRGRVYESVVTNVSKEASCFSDFPYPKEYSPYFGHKALHQYFKSYAEHFMLEQHIFYNTRVVRVERTSRAGRNNYWRVITEKVDDGQREIHTFDSIIICVGLNGKPNIPNIDGLNNTFKGRVMHSCEYDSPDEFQGKRVLVVGTGNSGGDIVSDISRKTDSAFWCGRSGSWIVPRMFEDGLPADMTTATRWRAFYRKAFPSFIGNWLFTSVINSVVNRNVLGFSSRYSPLDNRCNFIVNDELPGRIISGNVKVRPNLEKLTENKAVFVDGTTEEIDVVVLGTGFKLSFPFIDESILSEDPAQLRLFEWIFPYEFEEPERIAVVGIFPAVRSCDFPIFECQSRYVAQVMTGKLKLPSLDEMRKNSIEIRKMIFENGNECRFRGKTGFEYVDRLAGRAGFFPSFWKLLFRDPVLAFAVQFGPFLSYHYRLMGKNSWNGARERILNAIPNTVYALRFAAGQSM